MQLWLQASRFAGVCGWAREILGGERPSGSAVRAFAMYFSGRVRHVAVVQVAAAWWLDLSQES